MRAAILEKINAPLVVGNVGWENIDVGQVLVRLLVSGICGAQLQEIAGNKGNPNFVPHMLGHEGCGIVEYTGLGVTRVKIGDKVVLHWRKGEGIESDFPAYPYKGKVMRSGKVTTLSEYAIVSENRMTPVPQDTPNDFCALLGCGLSTALSTLSNEAQIQPGESIMIIGLGGLGTCFMKAAKIAGASPIVGVDIYGSKQKTVELLKGDLFIQSSYVRSIRDVMQDALGIKEVDVIIETTGNAKVVSDTIPLLAGDGRYILVGTTKPGESIEIKLAHHLFGGVEGKTIKSTMGGRFNPSRDIPKYVKRFKAGLLDIDNIITHRFKLEDINEALKLMQGGEANRIAIDL